ncbi:replication protein A 70 kDa DNA-binding subunit A-like [Phragmites australis]|uniref:replication protein A 70 kDa DNA-binding subunit A-like n=1 Tax=Phragmites australis TaxID=29695 RepID=UPI002D76FF91|nr:replication protein A 70 kDa DNA-binding subunit A-like [Phragmites australis]
MAAAKLTPDAVPATLAGDIELKPVVQVVDLRSIAVSGPPGAGPRFRAIVSDGVATTPMLFAAQLCDLARSGLVRRGAIVQLLEYLVNNVGGRRVIVVLNMEVLVPECEIIGNPVIPPEPGVPNPNFMGVDQFNGAPQHGSMAWSTCNTVTRPTDNAPGIQRSMAGNSSNMVTRPSHNAQVFQPTVQPSYRPAPSYRNHGTIMKNEAPAKIIPISALNPYLGRWAIKARVTAKGEIRRYHNAKGDGKVFSFDLLDSDNGEIRATCFNALVDRFYEGVEVGKVYVVSRGNLKPIKRDYNHLNNEWEIFLESQSTIELCPDENSSIPAQRFSFTPIDKIEDAQNNAIIDVIGVVTSVNPCTTVQRKNGMETQKRTITLKDMSGRSVEVTMWGDFCNREGSQLQGMVECEAFPVLAVKAGKVNDYSGKSVGTISSSQLLMNPDLAEAHSLRKWFECGGRDASTQSISRDFTPAASRNEIRKTVAQIKDESLGMGDTPDWVTVKATVIFFKTDSFCYTACPNVVGDRQCNKKVTKSDSGNWFCDKCNQEFPECDYRYLLQLQIQDHSGTTWATAFQESGQELLGCSARELYMFKENDDPRYADILLRCLYWDYLLRLKVKEETYGDERRVKNTVAQVERVDPSAESKFLLDRISRSIASH